ncbi:hypothetical protein ACHAXT_008794 [Thalassiosira profunda]
MIARFLASCIVVGHHLQIQPARALSPSARGVHFLRCRRPSFDRSLSDFYRTNFHEKRTAKWVPALPNESESACIDDDAVYVLRSREEGILAALRLTRSKQDDKYSFLRALCVSREHRRQGLASRLLDESIREFDARHCYCFASTNIADLYGRAGFARISTGDMEVWPKWLVASYEHMRDRWSSKSPHQLGLFVGDQSCAPANAAQIILLQHASEQSRNTATGWLLDDYAYNKQYPSEAGRESQLNLQLHRWIWSGRNDAPRIEERINRMRDRSVHLLWTDSAINKANEDHPHNPQSRPKTYIILDGTWQEAKQIYRKTPVLWNLPRVSLQSNVPPSTYVLRGDYGWKKRFGTASDDGGNLLCTAEVAAAVMDECGDASGADIIRKRLAVFQSQRSKR